MKRRTVKRLLALSLGLAVGLAQPGLGYLTEAAGETKEQKTAEEAEDKANSFRYQDGELIQTPAAQLRAANSNAWKRVISSTGKVTCYNGNGVAIPNATMKGIDVSHHQGAINWSKVKKADVDFAIVRAGYGKNYTKQDDKYWQANADGCEKYGIPYGVYLYSYAKTTADAKSEADHVLRLVKGRKLRLPIYYDMEDKQMANSNLPAIAETFCKRVENAGYHVEIYAYKNWLDTKFKKSFVRNRNCWVAQWNNKCTYDGKYNIWQSTSNGTLNGISGRVDLDFAIGTKVLAPVTKLTLNKTSVSVNKGTTYQLGATIRPLNATNKGVTWSSSNTKVATVTSAGKVTAVAAGSATITAKAKDGSGKSATCKVTVPGSTSTAVSSIKLNKSSMTLKAGSSYTLTKTISPASAKDKKVTWKTSSSAIAKVSSAGKVTAVAPGKAVITATVEGKSATCNVYIAPKATTSFTYTAKTTNTIQLNWKKVSGASGYTIYRYDSKTKKNVAIHASKSTTVSYKLNRLNGSKGSYLSAGTSYTFRIAPYKTISNKKYYGSQKSVTATTKCKSPSVSKVSRSSSTKAKVTWKKVSGATGYVVYYSTKKGSGYKAAKTVSNKTMSYTKTGLKKGKTYYFKVCAYRKVGGKTSYSNYSNVKSIKLK